MSSDVNGNNNCVAVAGLPGSSRASLATLLAFGTLERWSKGSDAWLGTSWRGIPEEKKAVVDDFSTAVKWAKRNRRPLYLGEFEAYKKADMESRLRWLNSVAQQAESNNISRAI